MGPWLISGVLFVIPLIVINIFLRPDPRDVAHQLSTANAVGQETFLLAPARSLLRVLADPAARVALIALGLAQIVMVMVMTITPVHMLDYAHPLEDISLVISAHIVGMYGLSMVTGWLSDRVGRRAVIGLGGALLIGACIFAPVNHDTLPLAVSLFLLGLGWNCCFVAGSALLTDRLQPHERARARHSRSGRKCRVSNRQSGQRRADGARGFWVGYDDRPGAGANHFGSVDRADGDKEICGAIRQC